MMALSTLKGRSSRFSRAAIVAYLEARRRKRAALDVPTGPAVPAAPINLDAVDGLSDVYLSWEDVSDNEDGFRIYRNGVAIGETGPGENVFDDSTVVLHGQYTYSVTAFNAAGESAHSRSVDIEVGA
jgi:hypothetical protein